VPETFDQRMSDLAERVGDGALTGTVEVDQVYARYQHEGLDLKHPGGGRAKYLEQPLYDRHRDYLQRLADDVLGAGFLTDAMVDNMESLSLEVYDNAPWEFHDLRASGHPKVTSGGMVLYDRPPNVHRLTGPELRAKSHLRSLGFGHEF
jgi:hypothetical protein